MPKDGSPHNGDFLSWASSWSGMKALLYRPSGADGKLGIDNRFNPVVNVMR
jgi:hypothetical protein